MKQVITSIVLIIFICAGSNGQDHQLYKVMYSKFKHGMAREALDIGLSIFLPAHQMHGINVQVFQYATGPWDIKVMVPVDSDQAISSLFIPAKSEVSETMKKLAGGPEKFAEAIRRYNELTITEETEYVRLLSDPLQGTWNLVESGQQKSDMNHPLQKKIFQNGNFGLIYQPKESNAWSMLGTYYVMDKHLVETSSYTANGNYTGITVTWNYEITEDKSLHVSGPVSAVNADGKDVLQEIFKGGESHFIWQRD